VSTGGADPGRLDLPETRKPAQPVHLPRRVRRRRTPGTSLSTTVAHQLRWSVRRPAGQRLGSRGDHLRPRGRAKHAAAPFGVRHRALVGIVTAAVVTSGAVLVFLTTAAWSRVAGAILLFVALCLSSSLLVGRPFRSLHGRTDRGRERRLRLRAMLEQEAAGLELLARADRSVDPEWVGDQCAERTATTRHLVEAAFGPDVAAEFSDARAIQPAPGMTSAQADADAKAFFVRYLVAYLDKYPIAGDWAP